VDRELLAAAQRGDEAAFVDLIRARSNRLFAIAQRILRDIDRAEDALQDALVIAWRDLRGVRDPDRFDEPLFVERFSFAETPASDLAESDAVVDSIEITP
jgi:DNA-directed RNA polymerase specialized sigma24 family protein